MVPQEQVEVLGQVEPKEHKEIKVLQVPQEQVV